MQFLRRALQTTRICASPFLVSRTFSDANFAFSQIRPFSRRPSSPHPTSFRFDPFSLKSSGFRFLSDSSSSTSSPKSETVHLVGAIDQGTTSSRFFLFDPNHFFDPIASHQVDHFQHTPHPGWLEHDPIEILNNVKTCILATVRRLREKSEEDGINYVIDSVGITNQRETTVVWDKKTGKPLYNAIVWSDTRTANVVSEMLGEEGGEDRFVPIAGLPISTYFSGLKLRWLIREVDAVRVAIEEDRCCFGTIESWLVWNLSKEKAHVSDVTNASRTLLLGLESLDWEPVLMENVLGRSEDEGWPIMPRVVGTSEVLGRIATLGDEMIDDVRISGCIGDQQAAMVGHRCFAVGEAKNTFGTGCFLLSNIGDQPVVSENGLLTTVLYQFGSGEDKRLAYALEGSIPAAGSAVNWIRDKVGLYDGFSELERLVESVEDNGGVYFVPAFSGLFAPHWDHRARASIYGLTAFSNKAHICRALLEGVCFQAKEVLDAMESDSGKSIDVLKVDGGMATNEFVCQFSSDIIGIPVLQPRMIELTAIGAAVSAAVGSGLYARPEDVPEPTARSDRKEFLPDMDDEIRAQHVLMWQKAVDRTKGWLQEDD